MPNVVETPIKFLLNNDSGLSAIDGLTIWAVVAPERTTSPYITYYTADEDPTRVMGEDTTPTTDLVQITVFADTLEEIITVSKALKAALNRYSGTADGVVVQHIFADGHNDRYDDDDKYYQRNHDFIVHFEE